MAGIRVGSSGAPQLGTTDPSNAQLPSTALTDKRGSASGDLLLFNGLSFVKLPKGSTGQQLHVRSDGTVKWVTPQEVNLLDWGLNADGVITTVTIGAGTNSFTAPTGTFKQNQMFAVNGAAANGGPLVTTIQTVTPGNPNDTITLAASTTFAVTNARAYAATDDAATLQSIINTFAPTGALLKAPKAIIGLSTTVDFNIKGLNNYAPPLILRGAGSGFQTNFTGSAPTANTLFLNFGTDEIFLSSYTNTWGLELEDFAVQNLHDTGPDVAELYFTGWQGRGLVKNIACYGTGNAFANFTGTVVNGGGANDTITSVSTFAPSNVYNIKVGDYVFVVSGSGAVPLGTTVTAINPVSGTITLSSVGTVTGGAATLCSTTPNPGIGLWLDNNLTGGQSIDRIFAAGFISSQIGVAPPGGNYIGEGVRLGALTYSTNVTANLQSGSATITNLSTFAGWKPGATVTLFSGGGGVTIPASTTVLRVNRAAGTALLSAALTGTGSATGATLTMAATGGNSGNLAVSNLWLNGNTVGLHLNGTGGQVDGNDIRMIKATSGSRAVWAESSTMGVHISGYHIETYYQGFYFDGCSRVIAIGGITSRTAGTVSDGSRAVVFTNGARGNEVYGNYFKGNNWDIGVEANNTGATSLGNKVVGSWSTKFGTSTPLTQKYLLSSPSNIIIDTDQPWVSENITSFAYGGTSQPNYNNGTWQTLTVTNGTAFTLAAPQNAPPSTQSGKLTIEVFNNSGGAMGVITWGALYLFNGFTWTNPANGKHRWATFQWNGANWVCMGVSGADY